ncbi:MAG TPA: hypothetical protein VIN04_05010 [Myxococcota bacterium]
MTTLLHNGRRRPLDARAWPTLGDVLDACLASEPDEHVLLSLRLDGQEVEASELSELRQLATEGVRELEIRTRSRRAIAADALESAAEYAGQVVQALGRVASLLREGALVRGNALWADACEALELLLATVQAAAAALGDEATGLAALEAELRPRLEPLAEAQARGDWIALADGLDYELAPCVGAWPALLEAARARACTSGGEGRA